jgi:heterodisulfide reductase subunit D
MELDTCAHCALCSDSCPTYFDSKKANYAPGVRSSKAIKLYNKQYDIWARLFSKRAITVEEVKDLADSAFNCTLCGRCMETCPFGIQTHELWIRVREVVHDLGGSLPNVMVLENMLNESQNPYGLDSDMRLDWADYSGLEDTPLKEEAEIAYFVGCTTAFKGAIHNVAFSVASILNELDMNWTLLGEDEWCCGNPLMLAGDEDGAKRYAEHNIDVLESRGVEKVITSCAGCYRVFKWEYPKLLKKKVNLEVVHSVEFLRDKIVSKELTIKPSMQKMTYHDPCELSRLGGVIEAPREVMKHLTTNYIELPENKLDVRCCGGGGLLQTVNNDLRTSIVQRRIDQAKSMGIEIITSACPSCKLAFLDGIRASGDDIEVLDILELAARQLEIL